MKSTDIMRHAVQSITWKQYYLFYSKYDKYSTRTKRTDNSSSLCIFLQRESGFSGSLVLLVEVRLRSFQSLSPLQDLLITLWSTVYFPRAYANCSSPGSLDHRDYNVHAWSVMACCLCCWQSVFVFLCHSEEVLGLCVLCVWPCLPAVCMKACMHEGMHSDIYVSVAGCAPSHLPQVDREEMVDLWDEMLQISMLVKELPPSLLQSGTEEEEEMMFFSLWREMMSSVSRNTSRPRKSHT